MAAEFHDAFAPVTGPPSALVRNVRRELMVEECREYLEAENADDPVKIADALADIVYIAYGTALTYGIDLDAVRAEVHASNMTKDPSAPPGGKAIKGPRYRKPDIARVLRAHG